MKRNKRNIKTITNSPKFTNTGTVFFAFCSMLFIVICIALLRDNKFLYSGLCAIIAIFLFNLMLDIHGVEIDLEKKLIRSYSKIFWLKRGIWKDFKDFNIVQLSKDKLVVSTSYYSDHKSDTYYFYCIKFVNESMSDEIIVTDSSDYKKALKLAMNLVNELNLTFKNCVV